jgi:hypothetical protein
MGEESGFQTTMKSLAVLSVALIAMAVIIKALFWLFDDLLVSAVAGICACVIVLVVALRSLKTVRQS